MRPTPFCDPADSRDAYLAQLTSARNLLVDAHAEWLKDPESPLACRLSFPRHTDLSEADFSDVRLKNANFRYAILDFADFEGAFLAGANLDQADYTTVYDLNPPPGGHWAVAALEQRRTAHTPWDGHPQKLCFENANFDHAEFHNCSFRFARFSHCDFHHTDGLP